ncbi:MAG: hypothetical protein HZC41_23745 [Chloroflexi bacterium]|nr:hypothetical protein [Chloroflexota bacterium]
MQQDIGPVLVSICGLLCIGAGLLAVVIFLVLKATGRTLLDAFDEIGGVAAALGIGEAADAGEDASVPVRPRGRRNLRARAEALDFDSAVARQVAPPPAPAAPPPPFETPGQPVNPSPAARPAAYPATRPPASPPPPATPSPFGDDSLPTLRPRRFRRDRSDDADDDPDMLAGIMGEDE